MSISDWFKGLLSSRGPGADAAAPDEEIDINEARIDAGGSGALGMPGEPDSHASPAEELSETEPGSE